jgi:ferredoxin-NADP reductase
MLSASRSSGFHMHSLKVMVHTLRWEADNTISVDLRPAGGVALPVFEPGAHIDLHLPNGLNRSYSLCNDARESHRYVLGVLRDRESRGGSRYIHDQLRVGTQLAVSPPRNHFPLQDGAAHSVLVAGGIGITPLLGMARRLTERGRSFELFYLARTRRSAAFLDELEALKVPMTLHLDDERGGLPDITRLLARFTSARDLHLYACGPGAMLDAFERSCAELGLANIHMERFSAVAQPPSSDAQGAFKVELARSDKTFSIEAGKSILDTLLEAGFDLEHSCFDGVCGACETRVLAGEPDHRDSVLSPSERAANKSMMICVSGAKSATLRLDL